MRTGIAILVLMMLAAGCGGDEPCGGGPCGEGEVCADADGCGEAHCVVPCSDDWTCSGDAACDWTYCGGGLPICVSPGDLPCSRFPCGPCEVCGPTDRCEPLPCGKGLACSISSGECEPTCVSDAECAADERCVQVMGVKRCWKRHGQECLLHMECYPRTGYCGDVDGSPECVSMSCGAEYNRCDACYEGPEWLFDAPVIFAGTQEGAGCVSSPSCPAAAPVACQWSFAVNHPDALHLEPSADDLQLWGDATGPGGRPLDVWLWSGLDGLRWISFTTCHAGTGPISFAVTFFDPPGHPSNALCMAGMP